MIQVKLSMSTTFLSTCRQIQSSTSLVYYDCNIACLYTLYTIDILINRLFPQSLTALTFCCETLGTTRLDVKGQGLAWTPGARLPVLTQESLGEIWINIIQALCFFVFFCGAMKLDSLHHLYSCHIYIYNIRQFFLISAIHTTSRDVFISPGFFPTFFWCETSWKAWQSSSRVRFNEMLKAKVRQLPQPPEAAPPEIGHAQLTGIMWAEARIPDLRCTHQGLRIARRCVKHKRAGDLEERNSRHTKDLNRCGKDRESTVKHDSLGPGYISEGAFSG